MNKFFLIQGQAERGALDGDSRFVMYDHCLCLQCIAAGELTKQAHIQVSGEWFKVQPWQRSDQSRAPRCYLCSAEARAD